MQMSNNREHSYEELPTSREEEPPTSRREKSKKGGEDLESAAFIGILIVVSLVVMWITYSLAGSTQAHDRPCGRSWQEAEARGCKFNIMRHAWLAPSCFDAELEGEFNSIADWQFWADLNRTQPLTIEEVSKSTTFVRASPEYMEAMCAFTWRRLQRAVERQGEVEIRLAKLEQATPCQQFIMGRVPNADGIGFESKQEGQIWFNVLFPKCVTMKTEWYS